MYFLIFQLDCSISELIYFPLKHCHNEPIIYTTICPKQPSLIWKYLVKVLYSLHTHTHHTHTHTHTHIYIYIYIYIYEL